MTRRSTAAFLALSFLGAMEASAHLSYTDRIFTAITGVPGQTQTILSQATKSYGWIDGADSDWAKQDDQRYFKIRLEVAGEITISISAGATTPLFVPGFSLYSGVGHQDSGGNLDFDTAGTTQAYLTSLGGKKGAFNALGDWKIGNNDEGSTLISFGYIGSAADGTSATPGVNGDGVADGVVTKTFSLPAGVYTLVVSGATPSTVAEASNAFFFDTNVSVVPEPSSALLFAGGLSAIGAIRRRRSQAPA